MVPLAVWLLHPLGWTGIIGPCPSPELPPVSSKSYTPGPCLSRHAKPCGGTVGVQHRWAERFQIGLTATMESVAGPHLRTRAGGARQPWPAILLGTTPTRTTTKPGPASWAEETPVVQRPLRLDQLRVVERYKGRARQPRSSGHPLHPASSPAVLTLSCHRGQRG